MTDLKLGILLYSQAVTWPEMLDGARRVDQLGYDYLWTDDHLYACFGGDPYQPIYGGYSVLAAWAMATERTRLGLLVGANTFRNPGLVAKTITTIDHISGGRAILGLGGAWMELEHRAHGIDFGSSVGQRLDWMHEATAAIRALLDGDEVTSVPGGWYQFDRLVHHPVPVQAHLPIMIGGWGERKTLRSVAMYADMWNAVGTTDVMARRVEVLRRHCEDVGRDPAEIEFTLGVMGIIRDSQAEADRVWTAAQAPNPAAVHNIFLNGTPEQIAERLGPYAEFGFRTVILNHTAPYDYETLERLIGEVKPLVERG